MSPNGRVNVGYFTVRRMSRILPLPLDRPELHTMLQLAY